MALVDLKTDLKTLKYSQFGQAEPLIQKDHTKADNLYNSLPREITARTDDVARLTKYLARNPKFLLNQTLLRAPLKPVQVSRSGLSELIDREELGDALLGAAGERLSLLGQAAVAGTGIHLIHETDLIKTALNKYYIGDNAAASTTNGRIVIRSEKISNALENRLGTARRGASDAINRVEVVNTQQIELLESLQIIPFRIDIYEPEKTESQTERLFFRAYLDSLSDNFNSTWNSTQYIGRAEPLYNYTSFNRGVEFSFKIAAESRQELVPLYKKLNSLVGTLSPSYNESQTFMRGIYTRLTIGDFFQELPGFFTNISLNWNIVYPWELGLDDEESPRVPHILDASLSFTPVHNFTPRYGQSYIGTARATRT